MFWIITLIVGVVLLCGTFNLERTTGQSNTFARYASLALIGFAVGALIAPYLAG